MPFIDCKLTKKLNDSEKEKIKSAFGELVAILHKPESYLMVGIDDCYDLYFAGKKLENGAYVAVSLFGSATSNSYEKMTSAVCDMLENDFGISAADVYVTYHPVDDWGWNGENF